MKETTLNWVTEAMAARYLEISSQRVSQLIAKDILYSETHLGTRMVWFEDVKKYEKIMKKRVQEREERKREKQARRLRIEGLQK